MAKGFGKKESKKGTKREKAYLKLIDKLLKSQGTVRAINILRDNQHLIDEKLLERMEMVAMVLGEKGDQPADGLKNREAAQFLSNIAEWLAEEFGLDNESGVFRKFVLQMMAATRNNGNPEAAYPILHAYRQQYPQFIQRFYNWGITQIEEADSEKALGLAATMSMFGRVICNFYVGDRAENVEMAIACQETALQVINCETDPKLWGSIKDALATAYWNRINGAENQERAIDAYESALQVLTREVSPEEWGIIKNNLGLAYRDRIWGNKSENLEQAIKAHKSALQVRTRDGYPERWAKTQMDLAVDYRHRLEAVRAENLEQALAHCEKAFQVYTRESFPQDWADNKINLGNIYRDRISGDRTVPEKSENLEKAAQAFQDALAVFNRNRFPYKWALSQMNLGNVYGTQKLIPEAIERYRLALEILTPDDFPEQCLRNGSNMGNTALVAELWSEAIVGYRAAIAAIDRNLAMAISEARRQEIQAEAIDIYEGMVKACINDGQPEKAKEYAERSGSMRLMNNVTENNLTENNLDCNREAFDFLMQVMHKVSETGGDLQSLSLFLEANLDQLDEQLLQVLRRLRVFIQSEVNPEEFYQLISGERSEKISANPAIMLVMALSIFADAVGQLLKGNRAINIEIAIAAYELVYPVYDPQVCSKYWGRIQRNLGVFYRIRIRGDRAANQEKAIACHKNTLQIFTPESDPQEWGYTQNNLATVYYQRIKGDRAENMEQAIACCEEVLSVCTRDRFPAQWAYAKQNLGNFYG
ncbi:MAG: tetratricopeptide repeat protein [Hormoscilla sp. GUM202]|nr:tetratricopeptide repeat protein [Hormoscilla sp. GUM202]